MIICVLALYLPTVVSLSLLVRLESGEALSQSVSQSVGRAGGVVVDWFTLNLAVKRNNNNATTETTDPRTTTACSVLLNVERDCVRFNKLFPYHCGNMITPALVVAVYAHISIRTQHTNVCSVRACRLVLLE